MARLLYANVKGEPLLEPALIKPKRLDKIVAEWTKGIEAPFVVSVHRPNDLLQPSNDNIRIRPSAIPANLNRRDRARWEARLWSRKVVKKNEVVLITFLPAGGGARSGIGKIALSVAAIALAAFSGPLAGLIASGLQITNAFAIAAIQAGITIGGAALMMAFSRQNQDNSPTYGVTGGGNLPRPGDRIPVGYGTFWTQPDLCQPDYYRYETTSTMLLFKRMCIGAGKYRLISVRVGTTTFYNGDPLDPNGGITTTGITSPFPDCKIELIYGQESELVPSDVISSSSVTGQTIPLSDNPTPISGPFAVNGIGTLINKIQVDYSTQSYQKNGHETTQDLWFEYAPIDDADEPTGPWVTLYRTNAPMFATKHLRWSKSVEVEPGRYAVRARNNVPEEPNATQAYQWDGLRGYAPDEAVRPGLTELAMEVRAGEGLSVNSFSDVEVRVQRLGLVWDENTEAFVEGPIEKCVDIFVDMLRDTDYGGDVDPSLIDLDKVVAYRGIDDGFDEFHGLIRGPVTLWDALTQALSNFRSEPIRLGSGYTFIRDEPTDLRRHVFSRDEISRESIRIREMPRANRGEAHVIVEFQDQADHKRKRFAEAYYGTASKTPRRIAWPGVATYAHAMHLARWFAASGFYRRTQISFDSELMGRIPLRGQPMLVDPWFIEERTVGAATSVSGNTINLDIEVTVEAGWHAILRAEDGQEWGPVAITQGAEPYQIVLDSDDVSAAETATGITLAEAIVPETSHMTSVIMGPLADLGFTWLAKSCTPSEGGASSITALIDAAEVYAAIDAAITPSSPLTWALRPVEAPDVVNLTATAANHTSSLVVRWSIQAQVGAVAYEVEISYAADDDAWEPIYSGPAPVGEHALLYLSTGEPVYLRARAYGSTGLHGQWETTSFTTPQPVVTAIVGPDALDETLAGTNAHFGRVMTLLGERLDQISEDLRSTDEQRQDGEERIRTTVRSVTEYSQASVTTLTQTIATETSALAASITALDVSLSADIAANGSAISGLTADLAITDGQVSGLISDFSLLELSVGDLEVSVSDIAAVTIDPTGVLAMHSILLDVNGYVSGTKSMNDGTVSSFEILADIFAIRDPTSGDIKLGWDGINDRLSIYDATFEAGLITSPDGRFVIDLINKLLTIKDASDNIVLRLGYY